MENDNGKNTIHIHNTNIRFSEALNNNKSYVDIYYK